MSYAALANLTLILHLLFMAFIVIGQLLILVGVCLRWQWVRNPWFRWIHLLAVAFVVFENVAGITCPLTTWEKEFRWADGQNMHLIRGSEPQTEMNAVLWRLRKIQFPPGGTAAILLPIYVGFLALVLFTLVFAPPRWPRLRRRESVTQADQSPIVS